MRTKLLSIICNMCLTAAMVSLSQCSLFNTHQPTLTRDLIKGIRNEYEEKQL